MRILATLLAVLVLAWAMPAEAGRVTAKIDVSEQKMRVYQNGKLKHTWKVSTGRKGYWTPRGTYSPKRMYKRYCSKKYHGSPMPYSIFFRGGYAIHGTNAVSKLGRPASHGCVRLHAKNAARLYAMVKRHGGRIVVTN
ncbi:MAG: L,D-transpeptidase [Pseudomonadota bacterium]